MSGHDAPVRLIIVEDLDDVRESLAFLLTERPGLALVGVFAAAGPALAAVRGGLAFDLALVDLGLPDMPGELLIRELRLVRPQAEAVVLTVLEERERLVAAFRAGATGYLLKDTPPDALIEAIHDAVAGGAPMSPRIARRIVLELRTVVAANPLTSRETEVLVLLTRGATYAQIGDALGVAVGTVQSHIKNVYRKLEVSTKAEATAEAFRLGLTVGWGGAR